MERTQQATQDVVPVRYGIRIKKAEAKPKKRVEYIYDAVGMTPAKMRFKKQVFDYGSWQQAEFVKNNYPVLLERNGNEALRLNPNNYNEDIDGDELNYEAITKDGLNVMAAFIGGWLAQYQDNEYEYIVWSNIRYDEKYNAWHRTAADGTIREGFYRHAFTPTSMKGVARSLSGYKPATGMIATEQRNEANANGDGWDLGQWSEWNYISCLLKIMAKTDNDQKAYGYGNCKSDIINESGTLKKAGQFFGSNNGIDAVKVFHIENMWGNTWERLLGLIDNKGDILVKVFGRYNFTGAGYIKVMHHEGNRYGYVKDTIMTPYGRFATDFSGESDRYACCYSSYWNDAANVARVGGYANGGARCGSGYVNLSYVAGGAGWSIAAGLSYKMPKAA